MGVAPTIIVRSEQVPVGDLVHYPGNSNEGDVDTIRESLRLHGQYRGVVVQLSTNYVLAGNHTLKAARLEGWTHIQVDWVDVDDTTALKINLIDNQAPRLGKTNDEALAELLQNLGGDFAGTGFEAPDLSKLLDSLAPAATEDEDFVPPVPAQPVTQIGEVIRLGPHRLICGDSLNPDTYRTLLNGERAQLIVTSPPYNQKLSDFKKSGMAKNDASWGNWVERMASAYGDNLPEHVYQQQQKDLLDRCAEAAAPGASFFYNHKVRYRDKHVLHPFEWLPFRADDPSPWRMRSEIIWNRQSTSLTFNARMFYPRDERIFWLTLGDKFYFSNTGVVKAWGSVWDISPRIDVAVSAPFPMEVASRPILACSQHDELVLDPYAGSGTTLIACEKHGRTGRMIELNPAYCDVIVERWEKFTGQEAIRT